MEEINPQTQDREGRPLHGTPKAPRQTVGEVRKAQPGGLRCRGLWSRCGGENASKSTSWALCQECTDARKADRGHR
jgi:hypothetical protein